MKEELLDAALLTEDVMACVKRETQEHHQRLESMMPLGRDNFSLAEYQSVLEKFFGIYKPLEARISAFPLLPPALQCERRRKTVSLEQDLEDLGLNQQSIAALPLAQVPAIREVPELMGTMYVMEGATLGGQFISRAVGQRFGLNREKGCRFFSSYGPEVGSMWRSFGEAARKEIQSAHDRARFIATAVRTFSSFEQWLSREK